MQHPNVMKTRPLTAIATVLLFALISQHTDAASGTAFTYQGRLANGTNAAGGIYDLQFTIYDSAASGNAVAGPITNSATSLSNGLFTVALDFGAVFDGSPRWIEAAIRTNGAPAFTVLAPRQAVTATPYAIYAPNAGMAASAGAVSAAGLTGTLTLAQLPASVVTNGQTNARFSGTFAGDGSGLTNLTVLATGVTVPVIRSNVFLSGAVGPLAFINGLYAWSGWAYTNGAAGTNAVGTYFDGCWLTTNSLGNYLVDTCDALNPGSIIQSASGWEDANTSVPLPITTSFQGTSTILLSLFSGSESNLTLSGPEPIRFVGDGSQLTGTNQMAITSGVTADAFDFATWKSLLRSSFGSYSNWNRFGWQRTSEKIARNQPVTLLFHGLGLMLNPQKLVTGISPKILQYLPLRGYLNTGQHGGLSLAGGATAVNGQDANWFSEDFVLTGPTATITYGREHQCLQCDEGRPCFFLDQPGPAGAPGAGNGPGQHHEQHH